MHEDRIAAAVRDPAFLERFWAKVDKSRECWEWTGSRLRFGYGSVRTRDGKGRRGSSLAHRVSWAIANGSIPSGLCVLHTCDNAGCVNPKHLHLGTYADNAAEMSSRNRVSCGNRHPCARLTESDVLQMRAMRAAGRTVASIGIEYGVSCSTASRATTGACWKRVV